MASAAAPRRVLLIGNSSYQRLQPLRTPKSNVEALKDCLATLQSEPRLAFDLPQAALIDSLQSFLDTVRPGDFVLIYFSGYGYQDASGLNYLLPVDFDLRDRTAVNLRALSLRRIESELEARKAGTKMLLLDASRQAPGLPMGLASVTPRMNTVVSFSAAENQVAPDPPGGGIDSYTAALIRALGTPGSTPASVATRAYAEVKGSSGGKQLPFAMMQALDGDEVFTPMPAPVSPPSRPSGTESKIDPMRGLTYVWIRQGTFQMGCPAAQGECPEIQKPMHQVTISRGFWIAQTEVTQEAWQRIMGTDPSSFKGAKLPVESVSWDEAKSYCRAVGMRLPTEAEWEYAARGGSSQDPYGDLDQIAWYALNSRNMTHPVATKQANPWGLHDMLGNVWEWVEDWFAASYPDGSATDPKGPESGKVRTVRGGAWSMVRRSAYASFRGGPGPAIPGNHIGFRCAGN
jgi:formylglycine-generating enzyme required for sulfatase activity